MLRTGSASEAARVLDVSQPAVSKALRQLESSLGITLFERIGGRLHATPEADLLVPAIDRVFASVSALVAEGQSIRDGHMGQVEVGALPTLAHVFLPAAIRAVAERYPTIRVSLHILPTRQIVDSVARRALDLGFVHDLIEEPALQAEDLEESTMCVVMPERHELGRRRSIKARELRGLPMVSYPAPSPIGLRLGAAFARAKEVFAPTIEVDASTALLAIVSNCGFVGIAERHILSLDWWPGIRAVPLAPRVALRPRILSSPHRPLSAAAKLFRDEYKAAVSSILVPLPR